MPHKPARRNQCLPEDQPTLIEIPEEKLLNDICDLLMNELPKYLLELEEQSGDGVKLPPLRFAGEEEDLPVGVGMPYAVVSVKEGNYSKKDRIVQNTVLIAGIELYLSNKRHFMKYSHTIRQSITENLTNYRVLELTQERKTQTLEISLKK